ncbi:hypothetical protein QOT17_021552 [Balamuthia mandrillaris]
MSTAEAVLKTLRARLKEARDALLVALVDAPEEQEARLKCVASLEQRLQTAEQIILVEILKASPSELTRLNDHYRQLCEVVQLLDKQLHAHTQTVSLDVPGTSSRESSSSQEGRPKKGGAKECIEGDAGDVVCDRVTGHCVVTEAPAGLRYEHVVKWLAYHWQMKKQWGLMFIEDASHQWYPPAFCTEDALDLAYHMTRPGQDRITLKTALIHPFFLPKGMY